MQTIVQVENRLYQVPLAQPLATPATKSTRISSW